MESSKYNPYGAEFSVINTKFLDLNHASYYTTSILWFRGRKERKINRLNVCVI